MTESTIPDLKHFSDEMALRKQQCHEQQSRLSKQEVLATHLPSEPYREPTDEEVMVATKGVLVCGKNVCGGPLSMEQRRKIYRIMNDAYLK